jgi:transposase-like protein
MRYGAEQIEQLVKQQGESGVSVPEFCRSQGLSEKTFYVWRQRVKESSNKFARVQTGITVTLELPEGLKLQVPLESLKLVIAELRR